MFSPNAPVQYVWIEIGQTHSIEPMAHRQRVNVLGALHHDGALVCATQQRPTTRDDLIAFFDKIADLRHSVPGIVLLDNAAIHKGALMEKHRQRRAKKGLCLYYCRPTVLNPTASRSFGNMQSTYAADLLMSTERKFSPKSNS